ncbi:hypothetical protein PROFUN_16914, partial [Planoprotostelium fungivorum]
KPRNAARSCYQQINHADFNSGKYDLTFIITQMQKYDISPPITKTNSYMKLEYGAYAFLDAHNYVPPTTNLEKFGIMWGVKDIQKELFPYEWFDSLDKLSESSLPPIKCFYNKLRNAAGWWLRGRNYTQHFLNRILSDDKYNKSLVVHSPESFMKQTEVSSYEEFKQRFPDHLQKLHFAAVGGTTPGKMKLECELKEAIFVKPKTYSYVSTVLAYLFDCCQLEILPEVAIVLYGKEGSRKSIIVNVFGKLFGPNYTTINTAQFTSIHWDKGTINNQKTLDMLKNHIIAPELNIEAKYKNTQIQENYI